MFTEYLRNRFYLRGTSALGIFNTVWATVFNRVLVKCVDTETKDTFWKWGKGTDFPPVDTEQESEVKRKLRKLLGYICIASPFIAMLVVGIVESGIQAIIQFGISVLIAIAVTAILVLGVFLVCD